jgi:hypothetical protein
MVRRLTCVGLAAGLMAGCGASEHPAQVVKRASHTDIAHELQLVPGVPDPDVLLRIRGIGTFRALCDRRALPATEFTASDRQTLRVVVSSLGAARSRYVNPRKRMVVERRRGRTLYQHWQISTTGEPDLAVVEATISSGSGKRAGFPGCAFAGQASIDRRPRPDDDAPPTG